MIGDVYRFGMNSVCMCGSKQGLGAGKCAAWNCQNGNGAGGGGGVFSGGCTFTSPEMLTGEEGASANMATSVVSAVW